MINHEQSYEKMQEVEERTTAMKRPLQDEQINQPLKYDLGDMVSLLDLTRPEHFTNAPDAIREKIHHEQINALVTTMRHSAFYTIVLSTFCLFVFWPVVRHDELFIWYGLLVVVALGRHWLCGQYNKVQPSGPQLPFWVRWIWVASVLVGIAWCGLVVLVWTVREIGAIVFAACMLASLAFGSFAGMGLYIRIYLGSAIPQTIALAILFSHVTSGSVTASIMAVMTVLLAGMGGASLNATRIWRNTLLFLHTHQDLAREHREKSAVLSTILHSIGDGVLTVDHNGLITYLNPAAEHLTGVFLQNAVGKPVTECFKLSDDADGEQPVNLELIFKQVREAMRLPGELVLSGLGVRAVFVEVTISPLFYSPDTEVDGYVVMLHDVTLLRLSARELSRQARQDPLTGLLNRRGFERCLHEALESKVNSSIQHSVCYIDLDRFKAVNDTCGHQAGDELLRQVVSVIQARMRDSDVFARLGGDEFALLLKGCGIKKSQSIAEGICRAVAGYRFEWEEKNFTIGASIGVVPMADNDTLKSINEAADGACYRAKESGRGRVCVDLRENG